MIRPNPRAPEIQPLLCIFRRPFIESGRRDSGRSNSNGWLSVLSGVRMEINYHGSVGVGLALTCAGEALATFLVAALVKDQLLMAQAISSEDGRRSHSLAKPVDVDGGDEDGGDDDNGYGGFGDGEDFSSDGEEHGNPNHNRNTPKKGAEGESGRDVENGSDEDDDDKENRENPDDDDDDSDDDDDDDEDEDANNGGHEEDQEEEDDEEVVEEENDEEDEDEDEEALQPPKKRKK